jgi:hypothetical protein
MLKKPPADCLHCLRGVTSEDLVFGDSVDYTAFLPVEDKAVVDGWNGTSVNWDLSEGGALNELLNRKKNGASYFKGGAVRLSRKKLDGIMDRFGEDKFNYEFSEENGNKYHGNLLFSRSMDKRHRTTICGALSSIGQIIRNE